MSGNRLNEESSPYLRQHADNPVHWQPWDQQALREARTQDKPILLSIGYSACHWCHVMAHESFEDVGTAAVMNEHFVNIKVDREERPDLDQVYQTLHQAVNREGGGWPLTVFLDPKTLIPFFTGTYFPPQTAFGRPGFRDILRRLSEFYVTRPEEIQRHNRKLKPLLNYLEGGESGAPAPIGTGLAAQAESRLRQAWDRTMGGFSGAPKFPMPAVLEFMLARRGGRAAALHTLQMMTRGGIHDHVGGGFYRYSVDGDWMIPHFEKMLYDNGALLALYAQAAWLTGDTDFRRTVNRIMHWAATEMSNGDGAYYAAQDADSEGAEGRYYLWTPEEVRGLLSPEQGQLLCEVYGLDRDANFEGRWHLWIGHGCGAPEPGTKGDLAIEQGLRTLECARRERVPPGLDDKVLCAWNALLVRGLALAGKLQQEPTAIAAAQRCVDFLRDRLWDGERLHASWQGGQARFNAYLDDHAFLLQALLELLQADWRDKDFRFAVQLADVLLDHFQRKEGGFFVTRDDHETLLFRPLDRQDDAMSSGNGIAAQALLVLAQLAGEPRYAQAACRAVDAAGDEIERAPEAHCSLLAAQCERENPPPMVLLRANAEWLQACGRWRYAARIYLIPAAADGPPAIRQPNPPPVPWALFCGSGACQPPITSIEALQQALQRSDLP